MSLFPIVQFKIGKTSITTVPPSHLVSFRHSEPAAPGGGGHGTCDSVEVEFLDSTFGDLEEALLGADKTVEGLVAYRWGYPGKGLEAASWREVIITELDPTLTTSGLRIALKGFSKCLGTNLVEVAPRVYKGKISSVVALVAKDMGFTDPNKIFIEETDDDANDVDDPTGLNVIDIPKAVWPTGNLTLIDFLRMLAREAKSKANPNGVYYFRIGSDGTFHFRTELYYDKNLNKTHRSFDLLFGKTDVGIEFSPKYEGSSMGPRARALLATTYDPRTKRYVSTVMDRETEGLSTKKDPVNAKTTAPPITKSTDSIVRRERVSANTFIPTKQVAMGGRCSGKQTHQHTGPAEALKVQSNAFKRMQAWVSGATLTLVGRPEVADFSVSEIWCQVNVIKKDKSLHWSTGPYRIMQVVHEISGSYKITATLGRATLADGPYSAKTGNPQANKTFDIPTK